MAKLIKTCYVIFFMGIMSGTSFGQSFSIVRTYPLYYDSSGKVDVLLWNCKEKKSYFLQVTNSDGSQISPMDCNSGVMTSGMPEKYFTSTVQGLITTYLDLKLSTDKVYAAQKLANIFSEKNFKDQLEGAYKSISDSLTVATKHTVTDTTKKKSEVNDTSLLDNITILTAANFDFSNKVSATYLGLFNIFAPTAFNPKAGLIAGIERISYSTATINNNDSSRTYFGTRNLVNPFDLFTYTTPPYAGDDSIRVGAKYHKQFYQYTFESSNLVWSFYVQPLYRIHSFSYTPSDYRTGVYFHLHFEFLVNEWTRTTNFTTIEDTLLTVAAGSPPLNHIYYATEPKTVSTNFNFMSSYFGAGFTFYIRPFPKDSLTHMFIQPTFGLGINSPDFDALYDSTAAPSPNGQIDHLTGYNNHVKVFYVFRASFLRDLTKNSQLVVGFSLRGLLPTKFPQYAAYIGLNVGLSALTNLFSSGKS